MSFDTSSSGTAIDLYCPVHYPTGLSGPTTLSMDYLDDQATSTDHVFATYYKMNKSNGVISFIARIDDATSPGCGAWTATKECSVSFTDTFNLGGYIYYVVISMRRSLPGDVQRSYEVRLTP